MNSAALQLFETQAFWRNARKAFEYQAGVHSFYGNSGEVASGFSFRLKRRLYFGIVAQAERGKYFAQEADVDLRVRFVSSGAIEDGSIPLPRL